MFVSGTTEEIIKTCYLSGTVKQCEADIYLF